MIRRLWSWADASAGAVLGFVGGFVVGALLAAWALL